MSQSIAYPSLPAADSPYWVESTFEVRQLMRALVKKEEKITLWASPTDFFMSVLLEVESDGTLTLDAASDPKLNQKVLAAEKVMVTAQLERVDLKFMLSGFKAIKFDGASALECKSPERIHKLQRREFYRIPTPVAKPVFCSLKFDKSESNPDVKTKAQVLDISLGGICLAQPELGALKSGQSFRDCVIDLPEFGPLKFDLIIRHVFEVENRLGQKKTRAGCEFAGLSNAGEALVQRYMAKLERDRKAMSPNE